MSVKPGGKPEETWVESIRSVSLGSTFATVAAAQIGSQVVAVACGAKFGLIDYAEDTYVCL